MLIDDILKLLELIKSWKEKRETSAEQRYEVLEKLFDKIERIHADYRGMYLEWCRAIPRAALNSDEQKQARGKFVEAREKYEWLRDRVREESTFVLQGTRTSEERMVVWSIIMYFLPDNGRLIWATDEENARRAEYESTVEFNQIRNTPSTKVLRDTAEITDPDELVELVRLALLRLDGDFAAVCRHYWNLRRSVKGI